MSVLETFSTAAKIPAVLAKRVFGTRNDRMLKKFRPVADAIDADEAQYRALSDEQLLERANELGAQIKPLVEAFEAPYRAVSREALRLRKKEHRRQLNGLDERIAETFWDPAAALVREASRRAQAHRHFNCQLIGGKVLYDGIIAEMKTGEGKTIVCHLAAFLKVLQGKRVHVITANDYLVKRDAEFAQPIFAMLGMTVGYIQSQMDPSGREGLRQQAYGCDITFGTISEFGFDYLRDNMKRSQAEQVQRSPDFAIIDEVDSLLIDEARTPLIISGPADDDVSRYPRANKVAADMVREQNRWDRTLSELLNRYDGDAQNIPKLDDAMRTLGWRKKGAAKSSTVDEGQEEAADDEEVGLGALGPDFLNDDHAEALQIYQHSVLQVPAERVYKRLFIVQRDRKQAQITHDGVTFAQEALDIGSLYSGPNVHWPHLIENALRSHKVYERDKDYVVQNGLVVIVDQFTGRLMPGRQWSDGLHQAIEAKESVQVKQETQTLATVTVQNYAHLYDKVAGMTGTAATEASEFMKIYALDVIEVPTNRPVNRMDYNDKVLQDMDEKYKAIVEEVHEIRRAGRPADPFVIAEALSALRSVHANLDRDTDRIDAAIEAFNKADFGDRKVLDFMLEVYDEQMGDLATGRPVLVGTTSVDNSEKISRMLERTFGIDHEVLNAKNHTREAEIIAKAGHRQASGRDKKPLGNVTIATNMAGRGTDIKLEEGVVYSACKVPEQGDGRGGDTATQTEGGDVSLPVIEHQLYPPGLTKCCMLCEEYDPATNCAHCFKPKLDSRFPELGRKVCPINVPCGLHIVGTERHESRRIDNQLRGRSGRQGDPGSSRFFLSLEDDLLKLFMPDWMLKMLDKHAFEASGMALEMKQLTKGIEKAQRKVEERNFATRKNLLEWDEPMDFQRKAFYDQRQDVLEGHRMRDRVLEIIDQAIDEAVGRFLSGSYNAQCIVDWCREELGLQVDEADFVDQIEPANIQATIRSLGIDDARETIRRSIGEYIDPDASPDTWDIGGLQSWVQRAYKVAVSKNQLRKMEADEITELLIEAAENYFEGVNLEGVVRFADADYPLTALTHWARNQFNLDLDAKDFLERATEDVADKVHEQVREAYRQREISYPVDYTLARTVAVAGQNAAVLAEYLVSWANAKFNVGWKLEDLEGRQLSEVREQLVALNGEFIEGGRLETEIDAALQEHEGDALKNWAAKRFGPAWREARFDSSAEDPREVLVEMGQEMLRWELGLLEHRVFLQLYDQAWKDHLLEMDRLELAIKQRPLGGDQTHPQSQYAIEGRDLFRQMWERLRERIVGVILKLHAGPPGEGDAPGQGAGVPSSRGAGPPALGGAMTFSHADATGAAFAGASADQRAAMQAQGGQQKVETIRREQPKVGRNHPCPCGSGKKFKQCCGKKGGG